MGRPSDFSEKTMRMQIRVRFGTRASIAAGALLLAASTTGAFAQAAYRYIDIGAAFSASSGASAINDLGQIVGVTSSNAGGAVGEAWRWNAGMTTVLPTLNGWTAWANDINNAGEIVGGVSGTVVGAWGPATAVNAVIWRNDQVTALTQLGAYGWAQASGINDAGVVVGDYHPRTDPISYLRPQAAQWSPSGLRSMLQSGHATSSASAINSQGAVVGMVGDWCCSSHDPARAHAAMWTPTLATLTSPAEWRATASDINDRGQVVGFTGDRYGIPGSAFLWDGGVTTLLGDPLIGSHALALNEYGQIVGSTVVNGGTGETRATLWQGADRLDLNTLIDPEHLEGGWYLSSANDINESGWIVGTARQAGTGATCAFLLTPVPEPATAALLLLGIVSVGLWSRRRAHR